MPEQPTDADKPWLPKWVLWASIPGIVAPIVILAFIVLSERAHDTKRCPFVEHARKQLAPDVVIVEESRRCMSDVEERQYVLHRAGKTQLLGERRLPREAFSASAYAWDAELSAEGEAQVHVKNAGHGELLFREGTAEDRAKWKVKN